jgi:uncharacterized membrane protein
MSIGFVFAPACRVSIAVAVILIVPMLLDGGTQFLGLRQSRNGLRLATGYAFGVGFGALLFRSCVHLWNT